MAENRFAVLSDQHGSIGSIGQPGPADKFDTTTLSAALKGASVGQEADIPAAEAAAAAGQKRPQRLPSTHKQPLVWVDLEMTGLNLQNDKVIEIACLITDGQLRDPVEGPNIAIHQPDEKSRRWCPDLARKAPRKERLHTALADIKESIQELRYYKKTCFKGLKD
ncbi:hypothetical protein WJX77_007526 [Trebouxia sp. C0004]